MPASTSTLDRLAGLPPGTDEVYDNDVGEISTAALLVDDHAEDRKIAQRLTASGLQCEAIAPGESLDSLVQTIEERVATRAADVILLDYRLDDVVSAGTRFPHRAGALAADLKERRPLLPLVLLTTEEKLQQWLHRTSQVHTLFDLVILKTRITTGEGLKRAVAAVDDLVRGFRTLEERYDASATAWIGFGTLLGATSVEGNDLETAFPTGPPVTPAEAANWLLRSLLDRPGPLLPLYDAAARLGVSVASFLENVSELEQLRYVGPFSGLRPRWWRGRLEHMRSEGTETLGASLEPAVCRVCGEEPVTRACAVCRQGIDLRHGVRTYEEAPLTWAEPRFVCYDCIAEGRAEDVVFASGTRRLIEELSTGEGHAVQS